jgi:hypothetical protein
VSCFGPIFRLTRWKTTDQSHKERLECGVFPIVMTVTGYCAPLTIGTIRISNKRCQLRIPAQPDCASLRTTVSTSSARRGNSKIISVMWQFSRVNGVCQSGRSNKSGSPRAVQSDCCRFQQWILSTVFFPGITKHQQTISGEPNSKLTWADSSHDIHRT